MAAKTETLTDTFTTLSATKWTAYPVVSVNGQLNCTAGGALISRSTYTLTASHVEVEVVNPGSNFLIAAIDDLYAGANGGLFVCDGPDLVMYAADGSGYTDTTFNPVAHRRLRLRESGGTLYWEASPDGVAWSVLNSAATGSAGVRVWLGGDGCALDKLNT